MTNEHAYTLVGEWAIGLLIAYICSANLVAGLLTWKIFRRVGGGVIAWTLAVGFTMSAFSWILFAAAVQDTNVPSIETRYTLTLFGLVMKASALTLICIGMFKWLDIVLFIRKGWSGTVKEVVNIFNKESD